MTEGSVSSLGLNSIELGQGGIKPSPEDVAWADSCLSKDPNILDSGWDSLKDALLETLSAQYQSSDYETDNSPEEAKMEILSTEDTAYIRNSDETAVSVVGASDGAESSSDDCLNHENTGDFWSSHKMAAVFLPTYNENLKDFGVSDSEADFVFQAVESEQSTEDIFKVWDLDIPPEEDDLVKQLNKALAEGSLEPTPPVSDGSKAWKDLQDEPIDDLISGIADLSLSPYAG